MYIFIHDDNVVIIVLFCQFEDIIINKMYILIFFTRSQPFCLFYCSVPWYMVSSSCIFFLLFPRYHPPFLRLCVHLLPRINS